MKPVVTEKHDIECPDKPKVIALLEYWDYQDADTAHKAIDFQTKCSTKKKSLSIETSMGEMKPVVMEENEFKIEINQYCWHIEENQE